MPFIAEKEANRIEQMLQAMYPGKSIHVEPEGPHLIIFGLASSTPTREQTIRPVSAESPVNGQPAIGPGEELVGDAPAPPVPSLPPRHAVTSARAAAAGESAQQLLPSQQPTSPPLQTDVQLPRSDASSESFGQRSEPSPPEHPRQRFHQGSAQAAGVGLSVRAVHVDKLPPAAQQSRSFIPVRGMPGVRAALLSDEQIDATLMSFGGEQGPRIVAGDDFTVPGGEVLELVFEGLSPAETEVSAAEVQIVPYVEPDGLVRLMLRAGESTQERQPGQPGSAQGSIRVAAGQWLILAGALDRNQEARQSSGLENLFARGGESAPAAEYGEVLLVVGVDLVPAAGQQHQYRHQHQQQQQQQQQQPAAEQPGFQAAPPADPGTSNADHHFPAVDGRLP